MATEEKHNFDAVDEGATLLETGSAINSSGDRGQEI